MSGTPTNYGRVLNEEWGVHASHALYHREGCWYNELQFFPGALFDPRGYVLFRSRDEYMKSPYLSHGEKLHVHGGIASIPGYVHKSCIKPAIPAAGSKGDETLPRAGEVRVGSAVTLHDGSVIVIGVDASAASPVGSALMGHVVGESVVASTPKGQVTLKIVYVS
jgi:hypothetical protein